MAITLTKTLQGVSYELYILTNIALLLPQEHIAIKQKVYQSKGHFDDDFVPIIVKDITITNEQRVNTIRTLLGQDYNEALSVVENFLVNNIPYYQGGSVSNGDVI